MHGNRWAILEELGFVILSLAAVYFMLPRLGFWGSLGALAVAAFVYRVVIHLIDRRG
ncbi:MAG: hypothetical protein L6E13_07295 [Firmicutes bacterium]|nr:hypothetical protein [Bacillota bacterium]